MDKRIHLYYKLSVDDAYALIRVLNKYKNIGTEPFGDMACFHTDRGIVSCSSISQLIIDIETFLGAVL